MPMRTRLQKGKSISSAILDPIKEIMFTRRRCEHRFWLGIAIAGALLARPVRADFVLYRLPGTDMVVLLEGTTKRGGFGILEYTHPSHGTVVLNHDSATVIKAPSKSDDFKKMLSRAKASRDVNDYISAANMAIRRGLLKESLECFSSAYKIDPGNETILRLIEARNRIKRPLHDETEAEARIREIVNRPNMKVQASPHYILLHDTSEEKIEGRRKTRADLRLELLETVYESYFMKFALDGILLDPPNERLMVVLFREENDYLRYSTQLDPTLVTAAGFWSPGDNACVFYDRGTSVRGKALDNLNAELKRAKTQARGTPASRDAAHLSNTMDLLIKVSKEEDELEVVSHEATHQLAGNTGLMPRGKIALRWAHEGLASYFETSSDAVWNGIGAVNERRLKSYYRVSSDQQRRSLELLVSDLLFAGSNNAKDEVDAYGQAWALTHYLMETKPEKLVEYYRRMSEMDPAQQKITREEVVAIFVDVFGDIPSLENDWHHYMRSLETDMDRLQKALK
jgi:hypothetical protein